ncbi:AbrB/MazE/SpoVT family DNA-binding domain-containing protein [Asticcacaulis sp. AND118]|uniref:AbrB/MazE/SpoVT family DNA-binding domain-containing protein n=1 Tax=Asticcacaulis sp. AND118 TaxID=2840468 RepID=UPI001CFF6FA4|nr:AbrB/MazE/SpoVT family DNA-binding domain-containing protein [Asticcacaulis sp. AND118]UDF05407.1 AbrB/MazE/SpoVT family DNA-binding domain-containing protein [Asticcacaulis sp. AND118]
MYQTHITLAANGRLVIPAQMRAEMGLPTGGRLVARLVDGAVILEPVDLAVKRAQALVRDYATAPGNVAEELIRDRRAAADHE